MGLAAHAVVLYAQIGSKSGWDGLATLAMDIVSPRKTVPQIVIRGLVALVARKDKDSAQTRCCMKLPYSAHELRIGIV